MTNSLLRDNLFRDTAPVPIYQLSATETDSQPLSNLVPRPHLYAINFVPGRQKARHARRSHLSGLLLSQPPATMTGGEQHNLPLLPGRYA